MYDLGMVDRTIIVTSIGLGQPLEPCPPQITTGEAVATLVQQADDNRRAGMITPGQAVVGGVLVVLGALVISGALSSRPPAPPRY